MLNIWFGNFLSRFKKIFPFDDNLVLTTVPQTLMLSFFPMYNCACTVLNVLRGRLSALNGNASPNSLSPTHLVISYVLCNFFSTSSGKVGKKSIPVSFSTLSILQA